MNTRFVWDFEDTLTDGFSNEIHDGPIYEDDELTTGELQGIYEFTS